MKKIVSPYLILFCLVLTFVSDISAALARRQDNLFDSTVYDSYVSQLQSFTEAKLKELPNLEASLLEKEESTKFLGSGKKLIKIIRDTPSHKLKSKREYHTKYIKKLRHVIEQKPSNLEYHDSATQEIATFIDDLCIWIYSQPSLLPAYWETLGEYGITYDSSLDGLGNFEKAFRILEKDKSLDGCNKLPTDNDIHYAGDVPTYLYTYPTAKNTRIMRISCPSMPVAEVTLFSGEIDVVIPEEFTHFIEAYQKKGKRHLYINNMQRSGHEDKISSKLEDLEKRFLGAFYLVTIDKCSSFYYQRDEFAPPQDGAAFKKLFLTRLFDPKGYYYWSRQLDAKRWKEEVTVIVEDTHKRYFDSKSTLNNAEKQDFIDLAHAKILDTILKKFNPETANMTCRNSNDRAPTTYAFQYLYMLRMQQKKDLTQSQVQDLIAMTLAPKLLTHNDPFHEKRFNRIVSPALRLTATK